MHFKALLAAVAALAIAVGFAMPSLGQGESQMRSGLPMLDPGRS